MALRLKANHKDIVVTDDFYYDLFLGGYIKPEDFLIKDDTYQVNAAIQVIKDFEQLLKDRGILDEF